MCHVSGRIGNWFWSGAVADENDFDDFFPSDITKFLGTIIIDDLIKPEDTNSNTLRDRWHAIYKNRFVRDVFVKQDAIQNLF